MFVNVCVVHYCVECVCSSACNIERSSGDKVHGSFTPLRKLTLTVSCFKLDVENHKFHLSLSPL